MIHEEKTSWYMPIYDPIGELKDKLENDVKQHRMVDVSVGVEKGLNLSREALNDILKQLKKTGYKVTTVPVWKKSTVNILTSQDTPIEEILTAKNNQYLLRDEWHWTPSLLGFDPEIYHVGNIDFSEFDRTEEMDSISKLIEAMCRNGASVSELENIVKYSMVVIDAKNKVLNWKRAAVDFLVQEMKDKYLQEPAKKHVVFISTPMAGLSDEAIRMNIESAKMAYLKEHPERNIQNTAFVHNKDADIPFKTIHEKPALLAQAFKKISQCDEVYFFGSGWIFASGCLMEYELCRLYDIPYTIAGLEDDK